MAFGQSMDFFANGLKNRDTTVGSRISSVTLLGSSQWFLHHLLARERVGRVWLTSQFTEQRSLVGQVQDGAGAEGWCPKRRFLQR